MTIEEWNNSDRLDALEDDMALVKAALSTMAPREQRPAKLTIAKVVFQAMQMRVFLSDGTELGGIVNVSRNDDGAVIHVRADEGAEFVGI